MKRLIFLIVYVLAIPAFGLMYWGFFPDAFYDQYAHFEPSWHVESSKIARQIENALTRSSKLAPEQRSKLTQAEYLKLRKSAPETRPKVHLMVVGDVAVGHIETDGSSIKIYATYTVEVENSDLGAKFLSVLVARLEPSSSSTALQLAQSNDPVLVQNLGAGVLLFRRDGTPWQIDDSFFRSLSPVAYGNSDRVIILTQKEEDDIDDMLRQYAGLSNGIGGDWRRMVYFSAVVITTLGLGDIIPLTSGARLLVAFEATFGIVIAGFFINAVAEAAGRKPRIDDAMKLAINLAIEEAIKQYSSAPKTTTQATSMPPPEPFAPSSPPNP